MDMNKPTGMVLRDPQNKRYRAYCVYDEKGNLAGWMLGDEVDAEIVSEWLRQNAVAEKARIAEEKVVVPTDPEIVVLTEPVPVKKVKARKKSEIADFPVPELEDLIPEEPDGD